MTGRDGEDLEELAAKHGTDKRAGLHGYARWYGELWGPIRYSPVRLLEIGVLGGASLRMWRDFFPAAEVVGLDSDPACARHGGERIRVVTGRQEDPATARVLATEFPLGFDIVIDDGGHVSAAQTASLELLFPLVRGGGWYVVEDLHAGYWPEYGGGAGSVIAWMKERLDDLMLRGRSPWADHAPAAGASGMWESEVESWTFRRSLAVVRKKADAAPRCGAARPAGAEEAARPPALARSAGSGGGVAAVGAVPARKKDAPARIRRALRGSSSAGSEARKGHIRSTSTNFQDRGGK